MSENTEIRSALELLAAEPLTEQIDYYRKPFMVLWAAIQEAASDVAEDYDLPADMAQLWVAEQMRQVAERIYELQHNGWTIIMVDADGIRGAVAKRPHI